jgi:hypothetical protein
MTRWEYSFIRLHIGDSNFPVLWDKFFTQIQQLGEEGWEAVGEVDVAWGQTAQRVPVLMFKRPTDVSPS